MIIKTTYNIGSEVYYFDNQTIAKGVVFSFFIEVSNNHKTTIKYWLHSGVRHYREHELFESKEDIKSYINKLIDDAITWKK